MLMAPADYQVSVLLLDSQQLGRLSAFSSHPIAYPSGISCKVDRVASVWGALAKLASLSSL